MQKLINLGLHFMEYILLKWWLVVPSYLMGYHRTSLVRWSLYKYKYLWGVGGKGQDLSSQEGVSYTYTLRLF